MTSPSSCEFCHAPVGADDRLCWSCGEPVEVSTTATTATEIDLGATVDRAALNRAMAAGAVVVPQPEVVLADEEPELAAVGVAAVDEVAATSVPVILEDLPALATPAASVAPPPATPSMPVAGGFCASCGWSFAEAASAKYCGRCGTERRGTGDTSTASAEVSLPGVAPAPSSQTATTPPVPAKLPGLAPPPPARPLPSLSSTPPPAAPPTEAAMLADPNWAPDPASLWRSIGPIDRSWGGRVKRGWAITKMSLELMKQQPGLIGVPITVAGSLTVIYVLVALLTHSMGGVAELFFWIPALALMASISMTGQAVITQRIAGVINGVSMTNGQAFEQIKPRLKDVCCWGMLSATVGILIRSLTSGRGVIGLIMRIVRTALLIAWTSMTFFVLPVILFEGLSVGPAITRSKQLVRVCWGEGLVGIGILNALFNVGALACFGLAILFFAAHLWVLSILIVLATIVAFNLLAAIASPVFTLVMYRFATTGQTALGLSTNDLGAAFRRPKASVR